MVRMNEATQEHAPPQPYNPARKLLGIPAPTHRLIEHVAAQRGLTMVDALYVLARDDLRRRNENASWLFVPEPWDIKLAYDEAEAVVRVWHPYTPGLKLRRHEALALADALRSVADEDFEAYTAISEIGGHAFAVKNGGRYLRFEVDGHSAITSTLIASDLATVIEDAAQKAGPL